MACYYAKLELAIDSYQSLLSLTISLQTKYRLDLKKIDHNVAEN